MVHVTPHFALCAPAFGRVGRELAERLTSRDVTLVRTSMASREPDARERALFEAAGIERLETNDDLARLLDHLVADPETRCIVLAAAVCDWVPTTLQIGDQALSEFGKSVPRLQTSKGSATLDLAPSDKLIGRIRRERKDVFLVAFKATAGLEPQHTYAQGLRLLKTASANLVLANDVQRGTNVVITPEEFPYWAETRADALDQLAEMILARTQLSFVRTRVRDEPLVDPIALHAEGAIPANFLPVLRHVIAAGAFKPFLGKTSGHFGCVVSGKPYARISSVRKVDHNRVLQQGMAPIYGYADGRIVAGGAKPSVGEHTQHQIYEALGEAVHAIVHFHCPTRPGVEVPRASQRAFECGSVECGDNTAKHMREIEPGIFAVQLEGHGPNIAFHRDVPAKRVIALIERCFDLADKSGGLVPSLYP